MVDGWFLLDAMGGIHEEQLMLTKDFLNLSDYTHQTRRSPRKVWVTVLIAAILTALLSACGYMIYKYYLNPYHPEEELHYTGLTLGDMKPYEQNFTHTSLVINCNTDPEATDIVMRFGWLPEGAPEPRADYSFLDTMSFYQDHTLYNGWVQRPLAQILEDAGMTEEEAATWYCGYHWDAPEGVKLDIRIFDGADLYRKDLLLGAYQDMDASVINHDVRDGFELLEVQVDYRAFYDRLDEKNGGQTPAGYLISNYLFLYEPEQQYLIFVAGSDSAFPFETLEKIAFHVETRETELLSYPNYEDIGFLFLELGTG